MKKCLNGKLYRFILMNELWKVHHQQSSINLDKNQKIMLQMIKQTFTAEIFIAKEEEIF